MEWFTDLQVEAGPEHKKRPHSHRETRAQTGNQAGGDSLEKEQSLRRLNTWLGLSLPDIRNTSLGDESEGTLSGGGAEKTK